MFNCHMLQVNKLIIYNRLFNNHKDNAAQKRTEGRTEGRKRGGEEKEKREGKLKIICLKALDISKAPIFDLLFLDPIALFLQLYFGTYLTEMHWFQRIQLGEPLSGAYLPVFFLPNNLVFNYRCSKNRRPICKSEDSFNMFPYHSIHSNTRMESPGLGNLYIQR